MQTAKPIVTVWLCWTDPTENHLDIYDQNQVMASDNHQQAIETAQLNVREFFPAAVFHEALVDATDAEKYAAQDRVFAWTKDFRLDIYRCDNERPLA